MALRRRSSSLLSNFAALIQRFAENELQARLTGINDVRIYVLPTGERDVVRQSSRELLAAALGIGVGGIELEYTEHGKPLLRNDPSLRFSTSHTNDVSLIAITRLAAVGVDIERVRDVSNIEKILQRFFHEDDAALVRQSSDVPRSFVRAWTRGEASVKVHGGKVWDMAKKDSDISVRNFDLAGYDDVSGAVAVATGRNDWQYVVKY